MTNSVVIGSGWHPEIFRTEAAQLIGSCKFLHAHALECTEEQAQTLIDRSSIFVEVLSPGGSAPLENAVAEIAEQFLLLNLEGSVAVASTRTGNKVDGWSGRNISGEVGALLVEAGYKIDLTNPDIQLRIHLLAPRENPPAHPDDFIAEPIIAWGVTKCRGDEWVKRRAPNRPFFKPVSLDPRLARAMVNLAIPEQGKLLDPFCGTGGLIIEGILCDIDSYGSDLAWPMVTGARENAAWAQEIGGSGSFEIRNGSSLELGDCWDQTFDGFAFDPPYGRNSWKSSDEDLELFEGTLSACSKVAAEQANLVTLIPWDPRVINKPVEYGFSFGYGWRRIKKAFSDSGWDIRSTVPIRVHGSLARLLIHAEKK